MGDIRQTAGISCILCKYPYMTQDEDFAVEEQTWEWQVRHIEAGTKQADQGKFADPKKVAETIERLTRRNRLPDGPL